MIPLLLQLLIGVLVDRASGGALVRELQLDPARPLQLWRVATYGLVHLGMLHFVVNAWGIYCEWGRNKLRYRWPGLVLAGGCIAGGLLSLGWSHFTGNTAPTVGISAGIFALWSSNYARRLIRVDPVAWTGFAIIVGSFIALAATGWKVDNAAHLGGFLFGLVLGVLGEEP